MMQEVFAETPAEVEHVEITEAETQTSAAAAATYEDPASRYELLLEQMHALFQQFNDVHTIRRLLLAVMESKNEPPLTRLIETPMLRSGVDNVASIMTLKVDLSHYYQRLLEADKQNGTTFAQQLKCRESEGTLQWTKAEIHQILLLIAATFKELNDLVESQS